MANARARTGVAVLVTASALGVIALGRAPGEVEQERAVATRRPVLSRAEPRSARGRDAPIGKTREGWAPSICLEPQRCDSISFVVFSPDGGTLAYDRALMAPIAVRDKRVRDDNAVVLCRSDAARQFRVLERDDPWTRWTSAATFSPDGTKLAVAYSESVIRLWDVASGKELHCWGSDNPGGPDWGGGTLTFTPDGRFLIAPMQDRRLQFVGKRNAGLYVWDVATGKEVRHYSEPDPLGEVTEFRLAEDGRTLAIRMSVYLGPAREGPNDGGRYRITAHLWDVMTGKHLAAIGRPTEYSAEDDPAVGDGDPFPEAGVGEPFRVRFFRGRPVLLPRYCPSQALCISQSESTFMLRDKVTGKPLHRFRDFEGGELPSIALSPDGNLLAAVGHARKPQLDPLPKGTPGPVGPPEAPRQRPPWQLLIWDISKCNRAHRGPRRVSEKELQALWAALAQTNASAAYRAMHALVASPGPAVELMRAHLRPVPRAENLPTLIAELENSAFPVREHARQSIEALGDIAEPALRDALARRPQLETRRRVEQLLDVLPTKLSDAELRSVRAIDVLESIGTPAARQILEALAEGAPGSCVSQAARGSLERLAAQRGR